MIGKRSDVLIMSSEGPLGAYVNQHGYVHELMTLHKANGLALIGGPVKEYSWFPGYDHVLSEPVVLLTITHATLCRSIDLLFEMFRKTLSLPKASREIKVQTILSPSFFFSFVLFLSLAHMRLFLVKVIGIKYGNIWSTDFLTLRKIASFNKYDHQEVFIAQLWVHHLVYT